MSGPLIKARQQRTLVHPLMWANCKNMYLCSFKFSVEHICLHFFFFFFFTSWVILCYLVTDSVFVWTKKYIELKLLQRKVWKQGTPLNPECSLNNQKPHKETFGKSWWWWSVMMGGVFAFPTFTPTCVLCSEQFLAWSPSSTHRNMEAIITHHWEEDLDFKSWRAVSHGKLTPTS